MRAAITLQMAACFQQIKKKQFNLSDTPELNTRFKMVKYIYLHILYFVIEELHVYSIVRTKRNNEMNTIVVIRHY